MSKKYIIPTKSSFSGKDYDDYKLYSVDFMPFDEHQDEFAENINKIANIIEKSDGLEFDKEDFLESLTKAKGFACSTIILSEEGFPYRVYFDSPSDLEKFLMVKDENPS
jgi:hypothetical protein